MSYTKPKPTPVLRYRAEIGRVGNVVMFYVEAKSRADAQLFAELIMLKIISPRSTPCMIVTDKITGATWSYRPAKNSRQGNHNVWGRL